MSNKLGMSIVDSLKQKSDQEKQIELQKQSFIANTRLRMAETYLNTLLGRVDVDLTDENTKAAIVQMSVDYANELMFSLGITVKLPVE